MPENTESGRRENWDDGQAERKRKSYCRQSEAETKPETHGAFADLAEWMAMALRGPALRPSPVLAADGADCLPSKSARPPTSSISETKARPTGMPPTRAAPSRMPARRVSASKMSACGVTVPAAVLRFCRCEQTQQGDQNQNDAHRPHKEGNLFGHGLPIPRESISSLLLFACPEAKAESDAPNP